MYSMCLFAQSDTLSYTVTSVFNNGGKRTDSVELPDGYINNAYYADGVHYYWTKKLDANKKEKQLLEFSYSENYNFTSDLTIKIHQAKYIETIHSSGGFYGTSTTITTTNSTPKYELIKTIKVFKDKYIVYTYAAGQLLWTYYYDDKGYIVHGVNGDEKWTYKIKGEKLIETSPNGDIKEMDIDKEGVARDPSLGMNWAYPDLGTIPTKIVIPPYMDKQNPL